MATHHSSYTLWSHCDAIESVHTHIDHCMTIRLVMKGWSFSHQHWVCEARTHWAAWKMSLTSSIVASLFPMRWGATHTATAWYNWDTICITALFNACIDSLHGMTLTERLTALQQFDSTRSSPFEEDPTTTIAPATPSSAVAFSGGRWCLYSLC